MTLKKNKTLNKNYTVIFLFNFYNLKNHKKYKPYK